MRIHFQQYSSIGAIVCCLLFFFSAKGQQFDITDPHAVLTLSGQQLQWIADPEGTLTPQQVTGDTSMPAADNPKRGSSASVWCRLLLVNRSGADRAYALQTPKSGWVHCWIKKESDTAWQLLQSGSLLPLKRRSLPSNTTGVEVELFRNEPTEVVLRLSSGYSLYRIHHLQLQIQPVAQFEKGDSQRLLWQGLFLGIIVVMTLYNLIIFFAVKDVSYFHFVLSLVGIGLYFSFYYGIGIEYLWPHAPVWDTFCYTVIVPFNGLTRIFFTKTYLHTGRLLPRINFILNGLALICLLCLLGGGASYLWNIDILHISTSVIGVVGTAVLIMMLLSGIVAYYREGYGPARYFIWANVLLVVGGTLFILREMGVIPDNYLTRYCVQVGTLIQVITFALGLASRLNQTRLQLAEEVVSRERLALQAETEKKELIEKQKAELEDQVRRQTMDLTAQNGQLEDIIAQLKASELKLTRLNHLKDKLFSIISHDLRNPLATMQSTLKLITEHHNKLTEEEKERLSREAQASLDNLNGLLYNLLQWSRSQMNLLQFKPERFAVKPILENCAKVLRLNAHMKNIRIQVVTEEVLYGFADKDMVEFVVRNLLSNAIKFSHRASDVFIKATIVDDRLMIQVLDSGIGMNASRIQHLLYGNATATRRGTEKEKGTGLGLLISKDFIEKNGGCLNIQSETGKGSTFSFTVPLAPLHRGISAGSATTYPHPSA